MCDNFFKQIIRNIKHLNTLKYETISTINDHNECLYYLQIVGINTLISFYYPNKFTHNELINIFNKYTTLISLKIISSINNKYDKSITFLVQFVSNNNKYIMTISYENIDNNKNKSYRAYRIERINIINLFIGEHTSSEFIPSFIFNELNINTLNEQNFAWENEQTCLNKINGKHFVWLNEPSFLDILMDNYNNIINRHITSDLLETLSKNSIKYRFWKIIKEKYKLTFDIEHNYRQISSSNIDLIIDKKLKELYIKTNEDLTYLTFNNITNFTYNIECNPSFGGFNFQYYSFNQILYHDLIKKISNKQNIISCCVMNDYQIGMFTCDNMSCIIKLNDGYVFIDFNYDDCCCRAKICHVEKLSDFESCKYEIIVYLSKKFMTDQHFDKLDKNLMDLDLTMYINVNKV